MTVPLRAYRDLLAAYLAPQRPRAILLAILLLASIGLQVAGPQLLRRFVDGAAALWPVETLLGLALAFLAVGLVGQAVGVAAAYLAEDVGWAATNRLQADVTLHCLRLDLSFHGSHTPGELIERVDGDVTALASFFSQLVVRVAGGLLLLVGVLVVLVREDWRVGAFFSLFAAIALASLAATRGLAQPHRRAVRRIGADIVGFLEERLAAAEDLRPNGGLPHVLRRLAELHRRVLASNRTLALVDGLVVNTGMLTFAVGGGAVLALGADLHARGEMSLGTVYMLSAYSGLLFVPVAQITEQFQELQRASASIDRLQELGRLEPAVQDGPGADLPPGPLAVALERVSFRYEPGADVLRGVSLRLAPGQSVGLLGRTGCGKTTIARLLARLYDPTDGRLLVGSADAAMNGLGRSGDPAGWVDLRQLRLADLRGRVGVVTQEVQLFHASVRDNLTLFDPTVPDGCLTAALAELGLAGWLVGRGGLDAELAGTGALSAGEAQLLALARVFLRDPGLVILDEASSRLDPVSERLVGRATARLLAGRTGVVIAHRLATVRSLDLVALLEDGRIVEQGPPGMLAAEPTSRFAGLLRAGSGEALA